MAKVSVILPTYNRAEILPRSINSVIKQTYSDLELVVVDDASTDDTESVVKSFEDERIKYIKQDENKGANVARNTGISQSTGEYIAFQDSDDVWLPHKIQKQVDKFRQSKEGTGLVSTGVCRVWPDYQTDYLPGSQWNNQHFTRSLLQNNFIPMQAAMIRRECVHSVGDLDNELPRLQDWEMWIRLSKEYNFKLVDEALVMKHMDVDELSYSRQDADHPRALELIIKKHKDVFSNYPGTLSKHLLNSGVEYTLQGDENKGKKYILNSIKEKAGAKNLSVYALSYLPDPVFNRILNYIYNLDI
jgi:glycosyltransferase involved in cell wall biosynthesis